MPAACILTCMRLLLKTNVLATSPARTTMLRLLFFWFSPFGDCVSACGHLTPPLFHCFVECVAKCLGSGVVIQLYLFSLFIHFHIIKISKSLAFHLKNFF